ncbi:MAG TPA: DUF4149 domain-containing protein [Gemmatimonadaceae bacterium]|nr:DUF4149 domain-containing protein [Gemmatimonadaceae bacterium]
MIAGARQRTADATAILVGGGWLGAAVLVGAVVAPAAFAVLPSRTLAGALVGRVLPALFYWGIATGIALAALARGRRSGRWVTTSTVAGLVTAISCGAAQLVVAPRIERVRASIPGTVEELPRGDARRAEFGRLHGASVLWLGVGTIGAALSVAGAFVRVRREP